MKKAITQFVLVVLVTGGLLLLTAAAERCNKAAIGNRLNAIVVSPSALMLGGYGA